MAPTSGFPTSPLGSKSQSSAILRAGQAQEARPCEEETFPWTSDLQLLPLGMPGTGLYLKQGHCCYLERGLHC